MTASNKTLDESLVAICDGKDRLERLEIAKQVRDQIEASYISKEAVVRAIPEKEHTVIGKKQDGTKITATVCYCDTVLEIEGSDFPRRENHQDCPAIKAIDEIRSKLKLDDKEVNHDKEH